MAFRRLTGITPSAFAGLLAQLAPRHEQAEARRKARPGRKRKPGGGRKHSLVLADRLLMLLIYYRTYVTHAFLGFLFGLDDSAVGRNINPLQPLLAGIFRIPERRVELAEDEIRVPFFGRPTYPARHSPIARQRWIGPRNSSRWAAAAGGFGHRVYFVDGARRRNRRGSSVGTPGVAIRPKGMDRVGVTDRSEHARRRAGYNRKSCSGR
jgi:hypothetical protein